MSRYVAQRKDGLWSVLDSLDGSIVSTSGPGSLGADAAYAVALRLNLKAQQPESEVRAWRKARGWSQAQLATRLGVSVLVIKRWEGGSRTPPTYLRLALERLEQKEHVV